MLECSYRRGLLCVHFIICDLDFVASSPSCRFSISDMIRQTRLRLRGANDIKQEAVMFFRLILNSYTSCHQGAVCTTDNS